MSLTITYRPRKASVTPTIDTQAECTTGLLVVNSKGVFPTRVTMGPTASTVPFTIFPIMLLKKWLMPLATALARSPIRSAITSPLKKKCIIFSFPLCQGCLYSVTRSLDDEHSSVIWERCGFRLGKTWEKDDRSGLG